MRFDHTWDEIAVYDTNVWVKGLTEDHAGAATLIDAAVNEIQHVAISAYIAEEVRETFEEFRAGTDWEEHLSDFYVIIMDCSRIEAPSPQDINVMDVNQERKSQKNKALAAYSGVEAKDTPILSFAHSLAETRSSVTIYTLDRAFSNHNPDFNAEIEYIG